MKIILLGFLSDIYWSFYQLPSSSFSSINEISSFTSYYFSEMYSTSTPSLYSFSLKYNLSTTFIFLPKI